MTPDDPELSIEDVFGDLGLLPRRRAWVERERAKAQDNFRSASALLDKASSDHVQRVEGLLATYIHHVFFAFAKQALDQGSSAEVIECQISAFLPDLVERTFFLKHPCAHSEGHADRARFHQWAISVIHDSPSWLQVQEALAKIAARDADKQAHAQSLPNLPRDALIRIELSERCAREIYHRDKVPYFPTNPEFSFLEASIFRSISRIVVHLRLFAEAFLEACLKEYLEYAPSDLMTNEILRRSLEKDTWTSTDELWDGYRQVLLMEPASRRARHTIAVATGTIDQYPELEPWHYPESQQWADFISRMAGPESEMAGLNQRYRAAVEKVISGLIARYRSKAQAKLKAEGQEVEDKSENHSRAESGRELTAERSSDPDMANLSAQESEHSTDVRTPLKREFTRPLRELPQDPEGVPGAGSSRVNDRLFRKRGDMWELAFDGTTVCVRNSKGMHYLLHLLRSPGHEVHCAKLFMAVAGKSEAPVLGSAGKLLDLIGFTQYRSRMEDLESQVSEAERNNDEGRKKAAQEELNRLQEQILSAKGRGGRSRNAQNDVDKFRKSVSIAIGRALKDIRTHHPALADHLKLRITRGAFPFYRGDEVDWQF